MKKFNARKREMFAKLEAVESDAAQLRSEIAAMDEMVTLSVRVPSQLREYVKLSGLIRGKTLQEVVAEALAEWAEKNPYDPSDLF